jgi:hypothetical protein
MTANARGEFAAGNGPMTWLKCRVPGLPPGANMQQGTVSGASIRNGGIDRRRLITGAGRAIGTAQVFADNDQPLPLGDGTWRTIERPGRYRHYFTEPENGLAGVIANAVENGRGCILIATLKLQGSQIAYAEQCVIRDPLGAKRYEDLGQPDPVWFEPIPAARRQPQVEGYGHLERARRRGGRHAGR